MGFVPQITCKYCGKKYSGLKSVCPYCGTRRVKASDRAPVSAAATQKGSSARARAGADTRWQMIFGSVLILAVIAAVIALIVVSTGGGITDEPKPTPTPSVTPTVAPTPTPTPSPTPEPTPEVTGINVLTSWGATVTEFSMHAGDAIDLDAIVYPQNPDVSATWRSSDENVCTVDEDGLVEYVGEGWCNVIAECGAISVEVKVYCFAS